MCVVFIGSPSKGRQAVKIKVAACLDCYGLSCGRGQYSSQLRISISSRVIDVNAFINADASRAFVRSGDRKSVV